MPPAKGAGQDGQEAVKQKLKELDDLLDEAIDKGLDASQWYDRMIKAMINLKLSAISEFQPPIYDHSFFGWYIRFSALDRALEEADRLNDGSNFEGVREALKKARAEKKILEGWCAEAVRAGKKVPEKIMKHLKEMDELLDEMIDRPLNASQWYWRLMKIVLRLKMAAIAEFEPFLYGHSFMGWYTKFYELDKLLDAAAAKNDGFSFEGVRDQLRKARELKKLLETWVAEFRPRTQERRPAPVPPDKQSESKRTVLPGCFRLPEGAVYATAYVAPDSQIEVKEPGFAIVVTGEVVEARRVIPGDKLKASETPSVQFDSGKGLIVETTPPIVPLAVTAGLLLLNDPKKPSGLPVLGGSTTVCIVGSKPYASPTLEAKSTPLPPTSTQAEILNPEGQKMGELCTFTGIDPQSSEPLSIQLRSASGDVVQEARLREKPLEGTPKVSLDRKVYTQGQSGTLTISNQENYLKMLDSACFGGSRDVDHSPIRLIGVENASGLPPSVPFGTKQLRFTANRPGQIQIGLLFPRSLPTSPPPSSGPPNPSMAEANGAFAKWMRMFSK